MSDDDDLAITLPLDTVNRLLVMSMRLSMLHVQLDDGDREAIKTAEREIEQVKRLARN